MATTNMTNIAEHMTQFLKSHGGLDLEKFYADFHLSPIEEIVDGFTAMLVEAIQDETHMTKLKALTTKKSDKIKDPNKPTRGKSAYLFFCQDHRVAAKEELEETLGEDEKATVGQVTKKLGEMWKEF